MRNKIYYTLITFILICLMSNIAHAQNLSFKESKLSDIFNQIEKQSDYVFNYDHELISSYTFTGEINLNNPTKMMERLLIESPFIFEKDGSYILIVLPPKKEYTLCAYLKRAIDSSLISGANIYVEGSTIGKISDDNGFFNFKIKAHKDQNITITYLGLKSKSISVIDWDTASCLNIYMEEDSYDLGLITINYIMKGISEGSDYGSTKMNFSEVSKIYSFQEHDVLKIVQLLPGISSIDESASNLNIRGSTAGQNLILWEGVTLYNPGHVFGMISSINPYVVDKIDVYKSVYNPIFKDRIGGVIDISLPNQISNTFKGGFGTTFTESHIYSQIPVIDDKLSMIISGRYTTNKYFSSPTLNNYSEKIFQTAVIGEESSSSQIGFKKGNENLNFYDWNAKIMYRPTDKIFIEASYFKSQNKLNFYSKAAGDDLESTESVFYESEAFSTRATIHWTKQITSKIFINESKYESQNQSLFANNSESGYSYESLTTNKIDEIQFGFTNTLHLNKEVDFELAYSSEIQKVDYYLSQISNSDVNSGTNKSKGNFQNLIASFQLKRKNFSLMIGLRNTYYNELQKWFFSPRMNLQYRINDKLKFKFSAGSFYQFINQLNEIGNQTINANTSLWILSTNESDKLLNAKKISSGFIYKQDDWLFDIEAYYHKTNGVSNISNSLNADLAIESMGKSKAFGIDLLVQKNWKNYKFWFNYSLSKHTYFFPTIDINEFPANNDHRHSLSIFNTYKYKNWSFSLSYQYRSGLPYSIPSGIEQVVSEDLQTTLNQLYFDQYNNQRLDFYSRLDMGISYKTSFHKEKINMEIGVSLLNMLNRNNIFSRDYFIGDTESSEGSKIVAIEKFQIKRIPQLLIRVYL